MFNQKRRYSSFDSCFCLVSCFIVKKEKYITAVYLRFRFSFYFPCGVADVFTLFVRYSVLSGKFSYSYHGFFSKQWLIL